MKAGYHHLYSPVRVLYVMVKKMIPILGFLFYLFFPSPVKAQNTVVWERAHRLEKGANLSNWLEARWLGEHFPLEEVYQEPDLLFLKSLGIETIRLPVVFEWESDTLPPYKLFATHKVYGIIDQVIGWTEGLGMNLIIDNHGGRPLNDRNYESQIPRLAGMWKNIILKYKNLDPERVFFELRNEPDNSISNENLRKVLQAVVDTIRKIDSSHTLIVGANWWNAGWSLVKTAPLADTNLIYTFHFYDPHRFTHQGLSREKQPEGVPFPTLSSDQNNIIQNFRDINHWSETNSVPVFLGAFGVSYYADPKSRCAWIGLVGGLANHFRIPWAYWDILHSYESFGFIKDHVPLEERNMTTCFLRALHLGAYNDE